MNEREQEILQSQLNIEKLTIKNLKQVYAQAIRDCEKKIRELSMRTDLENIQSIVYQKQYQQAIKGQLEGILEQLHSNEFATISEYLTKCYHEGYIGTMYDLDGQGIPIIMPIDQEAVVKAVQIDSKLSKSLYESLGQDVNKLKTAVKAQVSRGIATGLTWNQVAENLAKSNMQNTPYGTAINNAIRIARTEGHRVQVASAMDAQEVAKSKGADILKQWNSTLDGRTRPHHRMLDGQIRELDEDFEVSGMKVKAPAHFGRPSEDCNCRCALSTRARWALDEAELETLKKRAEYFGLDKTEDFEDYKKKYLKASEEERVRVDVQKSSKGTSQEKVQEYRPINRSESITKGERGNQNIALRKVENTMYKGGMYISDSVELKPKQMHNIEKSIIDALSIVGDGDNLPDFMIISSAEMQTGALCAYNAKKNIIYIDSIIGNKNKLIDLQEGMACPKNPLSTYVHELLHWKDADNYRKTADITDQGEYLMQLRQKCKKTLDKLEKEGYNVLEISNYATDKYMSGEYDETLTEYRVLQLLGKDE